MKRCLIIAILFMLAGTIHAQFAEDALRYSQIYYQGTARNMAVGSALGAMGGDFSVLSTNPGGIGVFRQKDLSVTGEIFTSKVNSVYNGTSTDASKTMFDLSNLGYIISKPLGHGAKGWKFFQIGFGMNRLNNYNSNVLMQGINQESSRMDVYLEETYDMLDNGYSLDEIDSYDPFYLGPAWDTYLMDTLKIENDLYLVSPVPPGGILQSQKIETKGSNNEYLVSFGANFDDLLYVGATLGLPYVSYTRVSEYAETDIADTIETFDNWSVTENLRTTGWGVNLKIGILVRPIDWIRIGAAFHTPTYYWSMKDKWYTNTTSSVYAISDDTWFEGSSLSPDGEFKYKLTTPMRFIGDLSFVIKKIGFISAEYEYVNYSNSKFKSRDYGFETENDQINTFYKSVNNLRFGTEWRFTQIAVRAGYAIYGSPYANDQEGERLNDGSRTSISGGIGYRTEKFSLDFTYVHSTMKEDYYMYSYSNPDLDINIQSNAVENKITTQNFALTFRYFFIK